MKDKDLEFLNECSNDLLVLLADSLVYDQKGREWFTEGLSKSDIYKENYPHKMASVIPNMVDEIQLYGGNTILNIFRKHGVPYREILINVAKRLKANFNKSSNVEVIEECLLRNILIVSIDKMKEEDVKHLSQHCSKEELQDQIRLLRAGSPLFIKLTGFIVMQLSKKFAKNAALVYLAKFVGGKAWAVWAGPIAWVLTGLWAIFDITGPAYRVLVPCVITIAYMRQVKDISDDELKQLFE